MASRKTKAELDAEKALYRSLGIGRTAWRAWTMIPSFIGACMLWMYLRVRRIGPFAPILPPGPRRRRLWISARLAERWREKAGDTLTFKTLLSGQFVLTFDRELAKRILAAPESDMGAAESHQRMEPLLGAESIGMLKGEEHRAAKRAMRDEFKKIDEFAFIDPMIDSWPVGEEFDLLASLRELTSKTIALGRYESAQDITVFVAAGETMPAAIVWALTDRKVTVVPIVNRTALHPYLIGDWLVPKGMEVMVRLDEWPFGFGPRACPGQLLAERLTDATVARIHERTDLTVKVGRPVRRTFAMEPKSCVGKITRRDVLSDAKREDDAWDDEHGPPFPPDTGIDD